MTDLKYVSLFAVVFETAVNPSHGAETGSVVTSASNDEAAIDFRLRMFLQIANQLSDDTTNSPSESKIWQVTIFTFEFSPLDFFVD
jgi:hypothetical protein